MACGQILMNSPLAPLKTKGFVTYPGFTGVGENTTGEVRFGQAQSDTQVLFADLKMADPACDMTQNGANNECGLHFHSGTSCGSPTLGHYWNSNSVSQDPWTNMYNTTTKDGADVMEVNQHITTGYSLKDFESRVFVIHNAANKRAACAEVERVTATETLVHHNDFSKYPGGSEINISGVVGVYQVGADTQYLHYNIQGLDRTCNASFVAVEANACGLHIHAGTSCATHAEVGGHHWDKNTVPVDPWLPIRYVAHDGLDRGSGYTVALKTGLAVDALYGRALVVHDSTGARIACTLIEAKAVVPAPAPTPPTQSPAPPGGTPAPSPATTAAPSPATTAAPSDGSLPAGALIGVGILVLALCGGGGYFFMNQEGGGHEEFTDAPEVEMEQAQEE